MVPASFPSGPLVHGSGRDSERPQILLTNAPSHLLLLSSNSLLFSGKDKSDLFGLEWSLYFHLRK